MSQIPKKGDLLIITTKKSKDIEIAVCVKEVVNRTEIILQRSTNSFFDWNIYISGESWVTSVKNLGQVKLSTSVNNMNNLYDL